jgi:LemA protein
MSIGLFLLIAVAVGVVYVIVVYNRLVTLVQRAEEAWSDIEVQLKRRYDLIPNLIETVKGYATHEKETFAKVTEARTAAMSGGGTLAAQAEAQNMLSESLKSIFALSEAYPDLKANQNFLQLQNELADTENKIQASRRFYNANVRDLNTAILAFPGNLIANVFNFTKKEFFDIPDDHAAQEPVAVKF